MGQAGQVREIEIKLALADAEEHRRLVERLGPRLAVLEQVNLYFDTPDDALRDRGWSVRCRRENGALELTIKAGRKDLGEFMDRSEWSAPLPPEGWAELRAGRQSVAPLVQALVGGAQVPWPSALPIEELRPLGTTETRRQVFALPGSGTSLRVELDSTTYPDGVELHELELEVPGPATEEATQRLRELFAAAGVPWRVSKTTKQARFREALAKGR